MLTDEIKNNLARVGYEAYSLFTGGKTWDGKPMPTWDEVVARDAERGTKVSGAWAAAAQAMAEATVPRMLRPNDLDGVGDLTQAMVALMSHDALLSDRDERTLRQIDEALGRPLSDAGFCSDLTGGVSSFRVGDEI